jgi:hypothetical protein
MQAVDGGDQVQRRHGRVARRRIGEFALLVVVVYLSWRATTLGSGRLLLLSLPLFGAEMVGLLQLGALVLQSRRDRGHCRSGAERTPRPFGVVVFAGRTTLHDLERTLVACGALPGKRTITVIDRWNVPGAAELAAAHGASHRLIETEPADDPRALFGDSESPDADAVLWLDAGQTPMPDVADLTRLLDDPRVAVVQGGIGLLNSDSMAHVDRGRDETALLRTVLAPALSTRGLAPWFGPGSLVRRAAIQSTPGPATVEQTWVRLQRAGWRSAYEERPLIRATAPDTLADYLAERRAQAAREFSILRSADSPLTGRHIPARARLAHLALLMRFVASVRVLLLVAVLASVLVSGVVPFTAPLGAVAAGWVVASAATMLAHRSIAGSAMATGDWVRGAWRTIGADVAAMGDVFRGSPTASGAAVSTRGWRSLGHLRLLTVLVVVLEAAIVARGATIVWPDLLPAFTATERILVLLFAIGCLVPMLDVIQLVVSRRQRRGEFRTDAHVSVVVGGVRTTTIDLSAKGLAVFLPEPPPPDALLEVLLTLPRISGDVSTVPALGRVRSVLPVPSGSTRVGLEFAQIAPAPRSALIAFCSFDHPYLDRERDIAAPQIAPSDLDVDGRRRVPLGAFTLLAVVLGLATAFAGPAYAAELEQSSVCVTGADGLGVAEAPVGIATRSGPKTLGVTGRDGCLSIGDVNGAHTYLVEVDGVSREIVQDLTEEPVANLGSGIVTVRILDLDGKPVGGGPVRYFGAGWNEAPDTSETGISTVEVLDGITQFEVALADQRVVVPVTIEGRGRMVVRMSRLVADRGAEVTDINTGNGWQDFTDGMDILRGRIAVRSADGTVTKLVIGAGVEVSIPSGEVSGS